MQSELRVAERIAVLADQATLAVFLELGIGRLHPTHKMIEDALGLSQGVLYKRLQRLLSAGLLSRDRRGRVVTYCLSPFGHRALDFLQGSSESIAGTPASMSLAHCQQTNDQAEDSTDIDDSEEW